MEEDASPGLGGIGCVGMSSVSRSRIRLEL